MHDLHNVLLLITGKSGNCFHSNNIIFNFTIRGDGLRKNLKSNETRTFGESCQSLFIFFLEQVYLFSSLRWSRFFFMLGTALLHYHRVHLLSELHNYKQNFFIFFPRFKAPITYLSINLINLESLFTFYLLYQRYKSLFFIRKSFFCLSLDFLNIMLEISLRFS